MEMDEAKRGGAEAAEEDAEKELRILTTDFTDVHG